MRTADCALQRCSLQAAVHEPADVLSEVSRSDGGYEWAFGSLLRGRAVRFTGVRLPHSSGIPALRRPAR